jgi:hypothetical protein
MINNLNILSIKILNSNYKPFFLILLYFSIYYFNICLYETNCMGSLFSVPAESIPNIAESKRELISYIGTEIEYMEVRKNEIVLLDKLQSKINITPKIDYKQTYTLYEKSIETKQNLLIKLETSSLYSPEVYNALIADYIINKELNKQIFSDFLTK